MLSQQTVETSEYEAYLKAMGCDDYAFFSRLAGRTSVMQVCVCAYIHKHTCMYAHILMCVCIDICRCLHHTHKWIHDMRKNMHLVASMQECTYPHQVSSNAINLPPHYLLPTGHCNRGQKCRKASITVRKSFKTFPWTRQRRLPGLVSAMTCFSVEQKKLYRGLLVIWHAL